MTKLRVLIHHRAESFLGIAGYACAVCGEKLSAPPGIIGAAANKEIGKWTRHHKPSASYGNTKSLSLSRVCWWGSERPASRGASIGIDALSTAIKKEPGSRPGSFYNCLLHCLLCCLLSGTQVVELLSYLNPDALFRLSLVAFITK